MRVRVPGAARDFSPSQLPVLTLSRCPYSPRGQSRASPSVLTLKIPNTGSHTTVWTHGNTAHADRTECIAATVAVGLYKVRRLEFPASDIEIPKKRRRKETG